VPQNFAVLLFVLFTITQITAQQISQRQTCERFMKAVVRIDAGGRSLGTGFLVSPDGFIITAGHVIRDETAGQYFSVIGVVLPDGNHKLANVAVPISLENSGQDYAILKVNGESSLPFIELGSVNEAVVGSDVTIIGYPFSATTIQDQRVITKFCLNAMVAAKDLVTVTESGTVWTGRKQNAVNKDVKVDVIYFQGPSVKGISGGPVISRDTGHVIGIATQKLTGIGPSLSELKNRMSHGTGVSLDGLNPGMAVHDILVILDDQLANGLGAATGIDDPAYALKKAERDYERQHPKK
jgi:V8-like Glu-specific endopeptidase